ncbi:hypothetical protein BCV70DRAFT_220564 [Testicularia cyperi]|uniref:Zn(2)-C6 fungal-type domain-containing protein n=1 Tax=Testicularia cyperi TaxID=1882483 RepID=A0A317Y006_9BASI|nr:hypothetical protein BCV70DRAFT_220564 [Testicularia cyperi]
MSNQHEPGASASTSHAGGSTHNSGASTSSNSHNSNTAASGSGSGSHTTSETGQSTSNHNSIGGGNSSSSNDNNKRNRYQYSCLECQRRKQKCSRTFPCEKCVQRGISHLCNPPTNLHRPSRRVRARLQHAQSANNADNSTSIDDMDPYELSEDGSVAYSDDIKPAQPPQHFSNYNQIHPSGQATQHHGSQNHGGHHPLGSSSNDHHQQHSHASHSGHPNIGFEMPGQGSVSDFANNSSHELRSPQHARTQSSFSLTQLATVAEWPTLPNAGQGQNQSSVQAQTGPVQTSTAQNMFASPSSAVSSFQNTHSNGRNPIDSDQRSIVDADDAFIGRPALNGLGWNPFRRHEGIGTDLLSWTGQLGRGFGLVIPKYELRSVQQTLPSKNEADRLLRVFLDDFNWSRFPSSPQELTKAVHFCIERCPLSDDVQMLPLMAFTLSIFTLSTLDLATRPYPTRSSRTYFFAARKALSLSESLGLHTLDSLLASLNLCRYLDLCRVPRSTWLQVASCMRGAIDLGLHLDGSHLGQNSSSTLQRRVLWSHLVHQDREWSVLFGRPMTEIPFSSTPKPSLQDYLSAGLDLTCSQYLVVRDAFRFHIERISALFQELAASPNTSPSSTIYQQALDIDAGIVRFTESLPPCLSASLPLSGALQHQDFATTFYHHLCTNQILFFRSLLHRPFWMESIDMLSADKYRRSRQICVDLALQDLRGRRLLSRRLPVTMLCHLYGSAYSLLSMNTIIASDILFSLEFAEDLQSDAVLEKLGYIHEYVSTVRANIQESRGDHLAVKELYVMRSLLKRIQDKVQTLNPQSVGFQVLGVRYGGGCADRLAMTLSELQSAANLLLNMARAGVRVDDATRIPASDEDAASQYTPPANSIDIFLSNADEWLSSLLNPIAAAQATDEAFSFF